MSEAKLVDLDMLEECGYIIHPEGRVFSQKIGRFLKHAITVNGYHQVAPYLKGKKTYYFVHRLVAEKFIPKKDGKNQVNHINANKSDNHIENLEWVTGAENVFHSVHGSHTQMDRLICLAKKLRLDGRTLSSISKETGLSITTVSRVSTVSRQNIINKKAWTERRRKIGALMVARGRQQQRVADFFNVSEATVSRWVNKY